MFNLATYIDLPLVWGGLIAIAIFLYVLLDGFDLGVGVLFPFAPSDDCRNKMMNSIAPFWDGNETWLVLGGGGLLVAFPLAYAILLPAFYIPIMLMLLGLIFRGVAFEFRFKAEASRALWDYAFHFGSLTAAIMQGIILGAFVQGVTVKGKMFGGGAFDWLNGFSVMTGIAVAFGYALLGASWLIMKTDKVTQQWARKCAGYCLVYVLIFMGIVSLWMPAMESRIIEKWFSWPNMLYLSPVPLAVIIASSLLMWGIKKEKEILPFGMSVGLFALGYIGLAISLWPYLIPFHYTIWEAAAAPESLSLSLVGALITLPIILGYTFYCYYVFKGKATSDAHY